MNQTPLSNTSIDERNTRNSMNYSVKADFSVVLGNTSNTNILSKEPIAAAAATSVRKNKHRRSHAVTDFSTECFHSPQNNRHRRSPAMNQLDFDNILIHVAATSYSDKPAVSPAVEHGSCSTTICSSESEFSEGSFHSEQESLEASDSDDSDDVLDLYLRELYLPHELNELRSLARQQLGLEIEI